MYIYIFSIQILYCFYFICSFTFWCMYFAFRWSLSRAAIWFVLCFLFFSPRNGEPSTPQPSPMGDSRAAEAFFLLFSVSHLWPKNAKGWRYNHIAPYYLDVPCPFENSKFNWTIGRVVLMHSHQWIFILQILPRLLRTVFWKTIRLVDFMALCGTKAPANVFSLHVQPDVCVSSLVPSALKDRVRFAGVSLPRSSWVSSPREKPHSRTVGFHSFLRSFSTSKAWLHGTVLLVDNKNPRLDRTSHGNSFETMICGDNLEKRPPDYSTNG